MEPSPARRRVGRRLGRGSYKIPMRPCARYLRRAFRYAALGQAAQSATRRSAGAGTTGINEHHRPSSAPTVFPRPGVCEGRRTDAPSHPDYDMVAITGVNRTDRLSAAGERRSWTVGRSTSRALCRRRSASSPAAVHRSAEPLQRRERCLRGKRSSFVLVYIFPPPGSRLTGRRSSFSDHLSGDTWGEIRSLRWVRKDRPDTGTILRPCARCGEQRRGRSTRMRALDTGT